jgi:hypothetical protein
MYARGRIVGVIAIVGWWAVATSAQWPDVRTKAPLTASGTPDLMAAAPKLADGRTPDLSGVWNSEKRPCNEATAALGCIDAQEGIPVGVINVAAAINNAGANVELPMQPWAETLFKERRANGGKDHPVARCLPTSPANSWASFTLLKIVQTPDALLVLDEYMLQYRQIFLDGRRVPDNAEPMFKGYSVGKWSGDVLVVETSGLKDGGWLDLLGHPLTDQARITERIRRVRYGSLEVETTVDDPQAYTKTWAVTTKLSLAPKTELLEYVCNENEKSLQHMVGANAAQ